MKKNTENERLLNDIKESPEARYERVKGGNPYYQRTIANKKKQKDKDNCRRKTPIDGRE